MTIREQTELTQAQVLCASASLPQHTRGRERAEEECPIRTAYARDRDRILHAKAFRRLMRKTQVFLSPEGDHYRTRLTHTLEVSQIARTMAVALRLNEELTEASALGHDLGHTPFGHAGERALGNLCADGFSHAKQSVRVVERLEREGRGLNLTFEVRNAIGCHSFSSPGGQAATLEGQLVYYADKIAYLNHDLEDALRAGVLTDEDLPWQIKYRLGRTKSERITALVCAVVESSGTQIAMEAETAAVFDQFHRFMYDAVYLNPRAKGEEDKVRPLIAGLYGYFMGHADALPLEYRHICEQEGVERAVCDYISGMSDRYALTIYQNLFIPKSWGV